jgi:pyridoxine 5-phosphate synthase
MKIIRLGINIDHVATLRNARGEIYPEPLKAALLSQKSGASSVTIHLREDRRHIMDYDLKIIKKKLKIPLNLEIAPTKEMLKIALKHKPNYVCIVPEKRKEVTTEGGLNLDNRNFFLQSMIKKLKSNYIRVSLFIEPKISDVLKSKKLGADCIEIHTGKFCNLFNKKKNYHIELIKIQKAANYASKCSLEVHAGHGLSYKSASLLAKTKCISEFNIGHFIVADSIFIGLKKSIKKFKKIINK